MPAPTFMIVPSLSCQASCSYCFGPHKGKIMDEPTAQLTAKYLRYIVDELGGHEANIIFHGGEPLLAPINLWKTLLKALTQCFKGLTLRLNVQSNLWNLNEDFLTLFSEFSVTIGTSIDGPEELCDLNRGQGYYHKTMAGIEKARKRGLSVSAIATLTRQTAGEVQQIASFFQKQNLPLVFHGAIKGLMATTAPWALHPNEYADTLIGLYPWYIQNRKHMRIDTLDQYISALVKGRVQVCTFQDCLGTFLCIGPDGAITACQRFAGQEEHQLGNINTLPTFAALMASPEAMRLKQRQEEVKSRCQGCEDYNVCKGGCYYSALSAGDGVIDPLCQGYQKIYGFLRQRLLAEMLSEENITSLSQETAIASPFSFFQKGAYISLGQGVPPSQMADNARRATAIYALGRFSTVEEGALWLHEQKLCGSPQVTQLLLAHMKNSLFLAQSKLNNCYVHVTYQCNLRCNHCYAKGGERDEEMSLQGLSTLIDSATGSGFEKVVFTGGEPLCHSKGKEFLELVKTKRGKGTRLALRTNLFGPLSDEVLIAIAQGFDQVIASVDGDEETHDQRRGLSSYQSTKSNLFRYVTLAKKMVNPARLALAATLSAAEINGKPGASVSALANGLGAGQVRFKPILPIGRAAQEQGAVVCEGLMEHLSPSQTLALYPRPLISCGIGQNLFVDPLGDAYPCYAWCKGHTYLGNVINQGLEAILNSNKFTALRHATVDTIDKCRSCEYRYLCGGACRAWGNQEAFDLNDPPANCSHLKTRAEALIKAAMAYLRE